MLEESPRQRDLEADKARLDAEHQRKRAESAVEMIQRSLLIRQAALSGDKDSLGRLLSSLDQNTTLRFTARAADLGYKNPSNQQVYKFDLYPELGTSNWPRRRRIHYLPGESPHVPEHADDRRRGTRAFALPTSGGVVLNRIVALVEYKDPTRSPTVAEFDMCNELNW